SSHVCWTWLVHFLKHSISFIMFHYYVLLFVPIVFSTHAVLIHRSGRTGTPVNTVAGTVMLDAAEVSGNAPLFIDAFYDHEKPVAHVILNMKSFVEPTAEALQEWGAETEWTCEWTAPKARLPKTVAVLRGYTNVDAHASKLAGLHPPRPDEGLRLARNHGGWPTGTVEASFNDISAEGPSPHWAIVISCPTISALNGSSSARLNLMGKRKDKWVFDRFGIPVSESRFVKRDVDYAICTMVDRGPLTKAEYLQPWAHYHLRLGFTQLLVYVEENDTSWVEDAMSSFIQKDQVTIVPFYFGKISDKKEFLTQGAMESHCLYQARGMAKWIAHMDVDEYFDFIRPDVNIRNYTLPKSGSSDVALVVRNQFWGMLPESHRVDVPYPCHLNGKSQYIHELGRRSKVIMRPEHIDALFPHYVVKQDGYTEVHPDPSTELRLNHFKWCDLSGHGCFGTEQSSTSRRKRLATDDSDWSRRCAHILSEGQ
ncbi:unnamed protein product, partial [Prorocentrum cordatum]